MAPVLVWGSVVPIGCTVLEILLELRAELAAQVGDVVLRDAEKVGKMQFVKLVFCSLEVASSAGLQAQPGCADDIVFVDVLLGEHE